MLSSIIEPMAGSPKINSISWGHMQVEGVGVGKDFKLWPGGGREWDWQETNTHHQPGIQPDDVRELLDHGCTHIVLSRGMLLALHTCPETLQLLENENVQALVAETREAARRYNEMVARDVAVGGLFHSTC